METFPHKEKSLVVFSMIFSFLFFVFSFFLPVTRVQIAFFVVRAV